MKTPNRFKVALFLDYLHLFDINPSKQHQFNGLSFYYQDHQALCQNQPLSEIPQKIDGKMCAAYQTIKDYRLPLSHLDFIISQDPSASIQLPTPNIIRIHLDRLYIIQINPSSHVYYNYRRVEDPQIVTWEEQSNLFIDGVFVLKQKGQLMIRIFVSNIKLLEKIQLLPNEHPLQKSLKYESSPRYYPEMNKEKLVLNLPQTNLREEKKFSLRYLLPTMTMTLTSLGSIMFYPKSIIMPLIMIGTSSLSTIYIFKDFIKDKLHHRKKDKIQSEKDELLFLKQFALFQQAYNKEKDMMIYTQPSLQMCVQMILGSNHRIYEKNATDLDFLVCSVGSCRQPTQIKLVVNKGEAPLPDVEQLVDSHRFHKSGHVPLLLKELGLALVGRQTQTQQFLEALLVQLVTFHSYHDLTIMLFCQRSDFQERWHKWLYLKHFQTDGPYLSTIVYQKSVKKKLLDELHQLIQQRMEKQSSQHRFLPHLIICFSNEREYEGHPIERELTKDLSDIGITIIYQYLPTMSLPNMVRAKVNCHDDLTASLILLESETREQLIHLDAMPSQLPEAIRLLAQLEHHRQNDNKIQTQLTFFELYQITSIDDLPIDQFWQTNRVTESLSCPIGLGQHNKTLSINLHEKGQGPHGLVAGTTGSGKSEFLQTLILSLATQYSPRDLVILVIDFKGGGLTTKIKQLPHLVGVITNLDGAECDRSIQSIHAEIQFRQSLLEKHGFNHVDQYIQAFHQNTDETRVGLPHFLIICDEFAELKAQRPEFIKELISISRIGRSLGVHLILATQKPSGIIDDQIWSNSRLKIALKVATPADSNDILKTPDAAEIKETGRAYLKVGHNESYQLFQSAWSGAPIALKHHKRNKIIPFSQLPLLRTDALQVEDKTTLVEAELLADRLLQKSKQHAISLPRQIWYPPLPEKVCYDVSEIAWGQESNLRVPFALMDFPDQQKQETYYFDLLQHKHTYLCGASGYGKSVSLQWLLLQLGCLNTPEQLCIHLLDFGTNGLLLLRDLPQVDDYVTREEEEKLSKFLLRIKRELEERKQLLQSLNMTSITEYQRKTGNSLPVYLTVIEQVDSIKEHPLREALEEIIDHILKGGANLGCYLLLTGLTPTSLPYRLLSNITTKFAHYLLDQSSIKEIMGYDALEQKNIPGRLQIKEDVARECQVYLPQSVDSLMKPSDVLENQVLNLKESWTGPALKPIPMLPKELSSDGFYQNTSVKNFLEKGGIPFGLSRLEVEAVGFSPEEDKRFVVLTNTYQQEMNIVHLIYQALGYLVDYKEVVLIGQTAEVIHQENVRVIRDSLESDQYLRQVSSFEKKNDKRVLIFLDFQSFMKNSQLTSIEFEQLFQLIHQQTYLLMMMKQSTLESHFDDRTKVVKQQLVKGLIASRMIDQTLLKIKGSFKEDYLEEDELNYFNGRLVKTIKLPNLTDY